MTTQAQTKLSPAAVSPHAAAFCTPPAPTATISVRRTMPPHLITKMQSANECQLCGDDLTGRNSGYETVNKGTLNLLLCSCCGEHISEKTCIKESSVLPKWQFIFQYPSPELVTFLETAEAEKLVDFSYDEW